MNFVKQLAVSVMLGALGLSLCTAATFAAECGLPVCDVSAKLTELRSMDSSGRFNFYRNMNAQYRRENSGDVLQNLKEFGKAAKALSKELKDEDWVIREAGYIYDLGLIGTSKFSVKSSDQLVDDYHEISNQNGRWEVLSYWTTLVPELEDVEMLKILLTFGGAAAQFSATSGDDEYIVREANTIVTLASSRLVALNPIHEGMYEIVLDCGTGNTADAGALCRQEYPIDRLVLLNTEDESGLTAVFLNHELGRAEFIFRQVVLGRGGLRLEAASSIGSIIPADFAIELDPNTLKIQGRLHSSRSKVVAALTGHTVGTFAGFYADQGAPVMLEPSQVEGTYTGTFGKMRGTLAVYWVQPPRGSAYFVGVFTDEVTGMQISFQRGTYLQKRGILNLLFTSPSTGLSQKWSLALRRNDHWELGWTGLSISELTGAYGRLSFVRSDAK